LKFLFTILMVFTLIHDTYSQEESYFKPYIGWGATNIAGNPENNINTIESSTHSEPGLSGIYSFSAGAELEWHTGKWLISTGLQYLQTGNKNWNDTSGTITKISHNLMVPLNIGYEIGISKRFMIVPQTGLAPSLRIERKGTNKQAVSSRRSLYRFGGPICLFSNTSVSLEYKLTKGLVLFAAPMFYITINNIDGNQQNETDKTFEHPYALHLSFGCMLSL